MKKALFVAVLLVFLVSSNSYCNIYIGVGANYLFPIGSFKEYNQNSFGIRFELTNRNYCKLWYGFRFDYIPLERNQSAVNYFERHIDFSGFLKFAPFTSNCYDYKLIPYIEGILNLSSISTNDGFPNAGSNMGFGGGLGVGIAFNFKLFQKCWMLDLDGLFFAPNSILRDKNRNNLQSFNVGLTLSMCL